MSSFHRLKLHQRFPQLKILRKIFEDNSNLQLNQSPMSISKCLKMRFKKKEWEHVLNQNLNKERSNSYMILILQENTTF